MVTSAIVQEEISPAPSQIQEFFAGLLENMEVADISQDTLGLRAAYLEAKIVSPKREDDALHVTIATTSGCSLIVSWNFSILSTSRKFPCIMLSTR